MVLELFQSCEYVTKISFSVTGLKTRHNFAKLNYEFAQVLVKRFSKRMYLNYLANVNYLLALRKRKPSRLPQKRLPLGLYFFYLCDMCPASI
jgi:hypothetical protein